MADASSMAGTHSQLRFSYYDHKSYLSEKGDWGVGAPGRSEDRSGQASSSGRTWSGSRSSTRSERSKQGNALLFSSKATADALDEYNFTVFKVGKKKRDSLKGESNWWNAEPTRPGANPYKVKASKTINIHGEKIYDMLEKVSKSEKEREGDHPGSKKNSKGNVRLFSVREPPVRARNPKEKEVIEKVKANSFLANAPSTYVGRKTSDERVGEDGRSGKTQGRPAWVSSTFLEDNLEHASTGAISALKYVEERSRKFALAQSVAKLNHKMKKNHTERKYEQTLRPIKDKVTGLEKRQEELEKENLELQQLVKELAKVIEDHNQKEAIKSFKPKRTKRPDGPQQERRAVRSYAPISRKKPERDIKLIKSRSKPESYGDRQSKSPTRPDFDTSPIVIAAKSPPKQRAVTVSSVPASSSITPVKKQRSQWIQPRMTAKQKAMAERTQAFQDAMSYMSKQKKGSGGEIDSQDIEKTLEAFARAQAEAELRLDEPSSTSGGNQGGPSQSLIEGLDQRLKQVSEAFSSDRFDVESDDEETDKVVVVPTTGLQSQTLAKAEQQSPATGAKAPLNKSLRDDLMRAVQQELQKQLSGQAVPEKGSSAKKESVATSSKHQGTKSTNNAMPPGDIKAFMDDTNQKLEAISKQLGMLRDLGSEHSSPEKRTMGGGDGDSIVIGRPDRFKRANESTTTSMTSNFAMRLDGTSATGSRIARDPSAVTFSTLKKPKVDMKSQIQKQQLVLGADGNLDYVVPKKRILSALSESSIKSIREGKERYIRQQKQNDEFVYANAASSGFDPVKIAETLTELIIDDLLEDSARELSDVCDSICENVFEQEFNEPESTEAS